MPAISYISLIVCTGLLVVLVFATNYKLSASLVWGAVYAESVEGGIHGDGKRFATAQLEDRASARSLHCV